MSFRQKKYTELVNQYTDDLYRFAYWLSGSHETAQDLVQETHIRAWKNFRQLKDHDRVKPWLITILRRENYRRFEKKSPTIIDFTEEQYQSIPDTCTTTPSDNLQHQELHHQILKLDRSYREPLALQIIFGYSCKEIAQELEITTSATMTRLFRAKQSLKESIHKEMQSVEKYHERS